MKKILFYLGALGVFATIGSMFFLWLVNSNLTMAQFIIEYWWVYLFLIPCAFLIYNSDEINY